MYDITVEGLDELSEQLQDNYDNWSKELNSNLEKLTDTVSDVKDTVDASASTLNNAINEILKSFGMSGLTLDATGIPKFASGTKYVSKSGLSLTQDKGREIVFKDGSVLLPLEVGDAVMPNELTERMFNLAENYDQIVASQIPTFAVPDFNTIVDRGAAGTVVNNHYDSLITVEGNVDKYVVGDLKELTKNLLGDRNFMHATYKYTSNEIAKDLRKSR